MIAAPYDTAYIEEGIDPEKNKSKLLIIGDKDEIEAEMKSVWEEREAELAANEG